MFANVRSDGDETQRMQRAHRVRASRGVCQPFGVAQDRLCRFRRESVAHPQLGSQMLRCRTAKSSEAPNVRFRPIADISSVARIGCDALTSAIQTTFVR